jgi:hypothetical protein
MTTRSMRTNVEKDLRGRESGRQDRRTESICPGPCDRVAVNGHSHHSGHPHDGGDRCFRYQE